MTITVIRLPRATGSSHTISAISQPAKIARRKLAPGPTAWASVATRSKDPFDHLREHRGPRHHHREDEGAQEVGGQHGRPQTKNVGDGHPVGPAADPGRQVGDDRRQRVLGEQLLPAENHNQKPDRVADPDQQRRPGRVGQLGLQQPLGHQREAHREAGGDPRPGQRRSGTRQLRLAFGAHRLVDDGRRRRDPPLRLFSPSPARRAGASARGCCDPRRDAGRPWYRRNLRRRTPSSSHNQRFVPMLPIVMLGPNRSDQWLAVIGMIRRPRGVACTRCAARRRPRREGSPPPAWARPGCRSECSRPPLPGWPASAETRNWSSTPAPRPSLPARAQSVPRALPDPARSAARAPRSSTSGRRWGR